MDREEKGRGVLAGYSLVASVELIHRRKESQERLHQEKRVPQI